MEQWEIELKELAGGVRPTRPVGEALVADVRRRRRRRGRAVMGSVLATAVIVAGVSVATAGSSPRQDNSVDTADQSDAPDTQPFPDAPKGSRWVGLNRVVVAVPTSWAVSDSGCGTTSDVGILTVSQETGANMPVDCDSYHRAPARIVMAPLGPGDGVQPLPESSEPLLCAESNPTQCSVSGAYPDQAVFIKADFIGPETVAVQAVLDTVMVLPDGWTTVPVGGEALLSTRTEALQKAGFTVDDTALAGQEDGPLRTDPESGSPVREGATIKLFPLSQEQDPETQELVANLGTPSTDDRSLARGAARWDAGSRVVVYRPSNFDFACVPEVRVSNADGATALVLSGGDGATLVDCPNRFLEAVINVSGLTEAPTELTVTEDGETRSVPVAREQDADPPGLVAMVSVHPSAFYTESGFVSGGAYWDEAADTLTYLASPSAPCPLNAVASQNENAVELDLTENVGDFVCAPVHWDSLVTISGLTSAPKYLAVSGDGMPTVVTVD